MSGSGRSDGRCSAVGRCRRPLLGGLARGLFRASVAVTGVGLAVTGILCLTTATPLDGLEGRVLSTLGVTALMISPYIGLGVVARMLAGGRVWRSLVFLVASVLVSGYGLLVVAQLWFLAARPVAAGAVHSLIMKQWIGLGAAVLLALVPGLVIGWTVDQAGAAGSTDSTLDARGTPPRPGPGR